MPPKMPQRIPSLTSSRTMMSSRSLRTKVSGVKISLITGLRGRFLVLADGFSGRGLVLLFARVEGYANLVFWGNIWVWLHWWSVQSLVLKLGRRLSNELMGGRRRWCFGFCFSRAWKVKKMFWWKTCFIPLSVLFPVLCCFLIKWRDGERWADWDDKEEGEDGVQQQWEDDWDDDDVTDDFSVQLRKELESAGES